MIRSLSLRRNLFNDQASGYDRARAVANDALRGLTLTGIGSAAKALGKAASRASRAIKETGKASKSLRGAANPEVRAAIEKGKRAHDKFKAKVEAKRGKGWDPNPRIKDPDTGRYVIPDALSPSGRPVELKPNTPSGRRQGRRQLRKYERVTGKKGRVVYYDP